MARDTNTGQAHSDERFLVDRGRTLDGLTPKDRSTWELPAKADPRDRIAVEIGDSKQDDFLPQLKVMRWDNACNLSLRLLDVEGAATVVQEADRVEHRTASRSATFYGLQPSETVGEDGGFEIDVTLLRPPASNVVRFSIVTKDVRFVYQPPLDNIDPDGSTWREDRRGLLYRPAHVSGSYAVYAEAPKRNVVGGLEYRTGKIGHLYRPRIVDASGAETWGDLSVDAEAGILTVTIPAKWLAAAQYPVRHAAGLTFGYTSVGGSQRTFSTADNTSWCGIDVSLRHTAGTGETITSYSHYCRRASGTAAIQMVGYTFVGGVPVTRVGTTASISYGTTAAWQTSAAVSHALTNGVNYCVGCGQFTNGFITYCDQIANSMSYSANLTLPTTWVQDGTWEDYHSMYATYTVASGFQAAWARGANVVLGA